MSPVIILHVIVPYYLFDFLLLGKGFARYLIYFLVVYFGNILNKVS
jgi:hypothetical protein